MRDVSILRWPCRCTITCSVLVTQGQGGSGEQSQAGRKLPQTEGKMGLCVNILLCQA